MPKTLQVRNVPDEVHRRLKVRAAESGVSLSELLLPELEAIAELPTLEEVQQRLASRRPVEPDRPVAEMLSEERGRGRVRD
jgi:plasmid stability protein